MNGLPEAGSAEPVEMPAARQQASSSSSSSMSSGSPAGSDIEDGAVVDEPEDEIVIYIVATK